MLRDDVIEYANDYIEAIKDENSNYRLALTAI